MVAITLTDHLFYFNHPLPNLSLMSFATPDCVYTKHPNRRPVLPADVPITASSTETVQECEDVCTSEGTRCTGYAYMTPSGSCELFEAAMNGTTEEIGTDFYEKNCNSGEWCRWHETTNIHVHHFLKEHVY